MISDWVLDTYHLCLSPEDLGHFSSDSHFLSKIGTRPDQVRPIDMIRGLVDMIDLFCIPAMHVLVRFLGLVPDLLSPEKPVLRRLLETAFCRWVVHPTNHVLRRIALDAFPEGFVVPVAVLGVQEASPRILSILSQDPLRLDEEICGLPIDDCLLRSLSRLRGIKMPRTSALLGERVFKGTVGPYVYVALAVLGGGSDPQAFMDVMLRHLGASEKRWTITALHCLGLLGPVALPRAKDCLWEMLREENTPKNARHHASIALGRMMRGTDGAEKVIMDPLVKVHSVAVFLFSQAVNKEEDQ